VACVWPPEEDERRLAPIIEEMRTNAKRYELAKGT
jgi:hypothetical protein